MDVCCGYVEIAPPGKALPKRGGALSTHAAKADPLRVLDALSAARPTTRPLFGCVAVYANGKIVLALREKASATADNGVWLATTTSHHETLRREFPNMRSIGLLGKSVTGWQLLPADAPDFEEAVLRACEMVVAGDRRIGKIPKPRRPKPRS